MNGSKSDSKQDVALDVGAGNGMVGEELAKIGFKTIIGVDIIEEAAEATLRDRPGIYDDYFIEDLTALPEKVEQKIIDKNPSCMSIVAALGFDDIPPGSLCQCLQSDYRRRMGCF